MAEYIGFSGLVKKFEDRGMPPGRARAVAAKTGRSKYGKKKFQAAAKAGRKMGHK